MSDSRAFAVNMRCSANKTSELLWCIEVNFGGQKEHASLHFIIRSTPTRSSQVHSSTTSHDINLY